MSGYRTAKMDVLLDSNGRPLGFKAADSAEYLFPSLVAAQSANAASVTGTTNETALASVTIPGGMLGPNGVLRITFLTSNNNNANNKTFRLKLGNQVLMPYTYTTTVQAHQNFVLRNRGQGAQVFFNTNSSAFGTTGASTLAYSVDTSVDQTFAITAQLANAADTATLEGFTVEVLPA